jgi:hypothetical protein
MEERVRTKLIAILFVVITLIFVSVTGLFAETDYVPKDPAFARRVGLVTGIVTPIILGSLGMGISTSSHNGDEDGDDTTLFIGLTISSIALLTPPLGNVYAGQLHKWIAILYGAANLTWISGTVSYYKDGMTTRKPTTFEGLMWFMGFALRLPAGVWDWITAAETAVRRNAEMAGISRKGYVTPFIRPEDSSFGVGYRLSF